MRPGLLLPLTAAGWLVLPFGVCHADEWVLDSAVGAKLSYNDNLNMQVVNPTHATWYSLSPSAKFSSRTEARDVRFAMGLDANRYIENSAYNATDYNFDLSSQWHGELDQFSLGATSLRNSTLNSETPSTGIVTVRRQRTQNSLNGAWIRSLDDTTQATLSANGVQVRYEKGPGLVDYDDNSAGLAFSKVLSDRTVLTASYSYRDFQTVNAVTETKTTADSYMLGGMWQYSERLSFGLNYGKQKTRNTEHIPESRYYFYYLGVLYYLPIPATTRQSESSGNTYAGSANYLYERSTLSANASRGLIASGTGALLRTDTAALNYGYRYDETLNMALGGALTSSRDPNGGGETRFSTVQGSMNWRLDQDVTLGLTYTHSTQRGAGQSEAAQANLVVVSIRWDLPPLSKSK